MGVEVLPKVYSPLDPGLGRGMQQVYACLPWLQHKSLPKVIPVLKAGIDAFLTIPPAPEPVSA